MCLGQGPQRSDASEARTRCPSVSSQALSALPIIELSLHAQALYHCATALPLMGRKESNQTNNSIRPTHEDWLFKMLSAERDKINDKKTNLPDKTQETLENLLDTSDEFTGASLSIIEITKLIYWFVT